MKNYLLDKIIRLFVWCLLRFSRQTRRAFAHWLATQIFNRSNKTRLRACDNIAKALPEMDEEQIKELALTSYKNIVFGLFECFWLPELDKKTKIVCDEQTLELLHHNNGVSIATMHMSCYELAPFAVQKLLGAVTTLSKIPPFVRSAKHCYQQANITVIDKNQPHALLSLMTAARKKQAICLHADHYANELPISFFSRKTSAPSGAAMLSAYAKTPLLICYCTLKENGHYQVVIETLRSTPVDYNKAAIAQATQALYSRFEQIIRQHPEQWYWSYNRWRK
ncbi:lysophospholipid acyltransferase family protein [Thalassotalea marina]|uniref:Lipid A biosynthesis acyltransferase n=1 Tax=Thalassotalea marina TaxID=1673741 RepID=A0A919EGR6_9GAMM|nr:lipid A biosynthesis acyltransferase [Thalassotalea marina]GHF77848.1 lipid A biosynthesis acyltransferase [Thalassotalea marina]